MEQLTTAGGPPGGHGGHGTPPGAGGYGTPPGAGGYGTPPGAGGPPGGGFGGPPGGGFGGPPGGGFGGPPGGGFGGPPGGGFGGPPGGGFGGPPGGGFGGGQRPQPQKDPIASKAKTAVVLAAIGVPLCCFPVSLVGGFMGLSAMSAAKKLGRKAPVSATIAMVLAGLSVVLSSVVYVAFYIDTKAKEERLGGIAERLDGKRDEDQLKKKIACLLVEERIVDKGFQGKTNKPEDFDCAGDLKVDGRTAQLNEVRFKILSDEHKATACFARGNRWFVVKLTDDDECGEIHPPERKKGKKLSEERLRKIEDEARDKQTELEAKVLVDAYKAALIKAREDAATKPDTNSSKCSAKAINKHVGSKADFEVVTVDYELLNKSKAGDDANWEFLTTKELGTVLGDASEKDKLEAVNELRERGNLVVVYRMGERGWPIVRMDNGAFSKEFSFDSGVFLGWMILYDLKTGERLCHQALAAQNSETVRYRKGRFSSEEAKAKKAVYEDFKDNLKDAATGKIKDMHPKLKLGYKFLE